MPPIETANAETIEPAADVTGTTSNILGASVFVAAESLKDQPENPYTKQFSITEVPAELTCFAVKLAFRLGTIQPGEMVFTTFFIASQSGGICAGKPDKFVVD